MMQNGLKRSELSYLTARSRLTNVLSVTYGNMDNVPSVPVLHYEASNFHYTIKDNDPESDFDVKLKETWNYFEKNGVLRYKLNIGEWKILEGSYNFLAQLNLERAFERRQPEYISSMTQPVDDDQFNFTKIPAREIFLDIGDGSGNDVMIANVSPVEWGHFLFVPERLRCLPHIIKESYLLKVMELFLLSTSPYLRVVFNSLCANASVNHLHFHVYYLKHQMLLERIELQQVEGPVFALKNFPSKGFCVKLSWFLERDIQKFARWAFAVITHLQENNIAHNVMITRARSELSDEQIYDDIRIFIWPRKSAYGVKDTRKFILGTRELFGHISAPPDIYWNLTEEQVTEFMMDGTAEPFASVEESLKKAISDQMK